MLAKGSPTQISRKLDAVGAARLAVEGALSGGAPSSDIAVLARVNALLAPVQVALVVAGVPIAGGVGLEFADRTAVRTVLAWLRLATAGRGGAFAPDDIREAPSLVLITQATSPFFIASTIWGRPSSTLLTVATL